MSESNERAEIQKSIDIYQRELDSLSLSENHRNIKFWRNKEAQDRGYQLIKWLKGLRSKIKEA